MGGGAGGGGERGWGPWRDPGDVGACAGGAWVEGTLSSNGLCVKQEARPASGSNLTSKPPPTSAHPGAIPRSPPTT